MIYIFGNEEIGQTLILYNNLQKQRKQANLVVRDKSYNAKKDCELLAEGSKKDLERLQDRQETEASKRLGEGMHQRQSSNNNFFDDIPESSSTVNRIVTPTKNSTITVETEGISIRIGGQKRVIITEDSMETIKSGKGKRKPNWTDLMKLQLLEAWCKTSYTPYLWQNDKATKKADRDETLSQMMRKFTFMLEGDREVLLSNLTSNQDNFLWRKPKN